MKPVSTSWEGDRASNVSAGPGENHGLLSEGVGEPWKGKEACCMSLRVGAGGLRAGNCPDYTLITARSPQVSSSECCRADRKALPSQKEVSDQAACKHSFRGKTQGCLLHSSLPDA